MDFSKARVGDRVWTIQNGWTEIEETNRDSPYQIKAGGNTYTIDGKLRHNDSMPSLYWSKPEITGGDTPPKRTKKVKVWARVDARNGTEAAICDFSYGYKTEEDLKRCWQYPGIDQQIEIEIPNED